MKRIAWLVATAMAASHAGGQTATPAPASACVEAADVMPQHLYGLWRAEFEGLPGATLLIEKHRELKESFSGAVNRNGERALLAGDVDDGEFTMEESADGIRISATWLGNVSEKSCGREIRGTWQAEGTKVARPFVLRKQTVN